MKPSSFKLPPQDFILSIFNLVCLALLYNGLKASIEQQRRGKGDKRKWGRDQFAPWLAEQLFRHDVVIKRDDGTMVSLHDTCVDDAFNDVGTFRWVSTFSKYATTPPKYNRLKSIQYRMELITAAFIISGLYQPKIEGWENPFAT